MVGTRVELMSCGEGTNNTAKSVDSSEADEVDEDEEEDEDEDEEDEEYDEEEEVEEEEEEEEEMLRLVWTAPEDFQVLRYSEVSFHYYPTNIGTIRATPVSTPLVVN